MRPIALVTASAVAAITGTASAQFWQVDTSFGLAEGISNNGVVSGTNQGAGQYFMWDQFNGGQNIGGVAAGNGVGGQATISDDGLYIAGTTYNAAMGYHEMGRYSVSTGTWQGFGMIPGIGQQVDAEVSSGWGISGDGRSVVGLGWTIQGTSDTHAMQWTEGIGVIDLGSNSLGNSARANGVSFDGSVVGGWQDGNGRQGAVWVNGVERVITTDTGSVAHEVFNVSGDGAYAVGFGIGGFSAPGNAYRYDIANDVYELIPNLAVGAARNMGANAVNSDGSLLGGGTWGFGPATLGNGFIWEEGVGTMTVGDFLDSRGVGYDPSFHFSFVSSISADGQWLTGWGYAGTPANTQTWVAHIPAPSALAVMGLGGVVGARRRRC